MSAGSDPTGESSPYDYRSRIRDLPCCEDWELEDRTIEDVNERLCAYRQERYFDKLRPFNRSDAIAQLKKVVVAMQELQVQLFELSARHPERRDQLGEFYDPSPELTDLFSRHHPTFEHPTTLVMLLEELEQAASSLIRDLEIGPPTRPGRRPSGIRQLIRDLDLALCRHGSLATASQAERAAVIVDLLTLVEASSFNRRTVENILSGTPRE